MAFAQIGPATRLLEALATAVGAGVLLGGVFMGMAGIAAGWSSEDLARRSLRDGYLGSLGGIACVAIDLLLRYIA